MVEQNNKIQLNKTIISQVNIEAAYLHALIIDKWNELEKPTEFTCLKGDFSEIYPKFTSYKQLNLLKQLKQKGFIDYYNGKGNKVFYKVAG